MEEPVLVTSVGKQAPVLVLSPTWIQV